MTDTPAPSPSVPHGEPAPRPRFGLRSQLIALFTLAFTVVLAAVFVWSLFFMRARTTEVLRADLNDTLEGIAKRIGGDEVASLYADGAPNAAGFSDDPRWRRVMDLLVEMHGIEPRAWGSVVVRGDQPTTQRSGPEPAASPEFIFLADLAPPDAEVAHFREARRLGPLAVEAWEHDGLVEVPDTHDGRKGPVMTSIGQIRDKHGRTVALLTVDFDAKDIREVTDRIKTSLITVGAIAYAVLAVLVYLAAGFFTRPILALTRYAETLDQESLGASLGLTRRPDELGALARAFDRMSRRLAGAFADLARANDELEQRVTERTRELSEEREKSEALLRNVLPAEIAERLKYDSSHAIAEGFDAVTVLFADIVGFTSMSARATPLAVVRLLNEIFSSFDKLADKYGLEKIKTIGDAYMIVGGLPTPRPDHVSAVADMALEMQTVMVMLEQQYPGISIRIGMNTGPVVAGVIGTRKFSYDLWGDTVNVASRMESHGDPRRIQVSDTVAKALDGSFVLERRGIIQVKGRGEMETFWLVSRIGDAG